jgi:hypothetical protein
MGAATQANLLWPEGVFIDSMGKLLIPVCRCFVGTVSGITVDCLNHGIDVTETVSIGLIVTLRIVVGAWDVVGINTVTIARVLEGL